MSGMEQGLNAAASKSPRTVDDSSDVVMTATGHLQHRCPHIDEVDHGHIAITWRVDGKSFELHSLRQYLSGFKESRISHEEITDRIRHDLSGFPGVELVSVETSWLTAGLEVKCSTSPIPAGQPW